jgi:hypothetical protein
MKYDDIKWHLNDEYPRDLDRNRALTHMGMFIGWVIDKGFEGNILKENFPKQLQEFRDRKITGAKFLELCSDNKLVSEDLNNEANQFAKYYYASDKYLDDYVDLSDDNNETIFHEPDNWDKYDEVKNLIEKRYEEWKSLK